MMKTKKKGISINPNDYANIHTGELLTEVSDQVFTAFEDLPTVTIHYDSYFTVNTDTINRLVKSGLLSRIEKGYILEFAVMIREKSTFNALYNQKNDFHTLETLSIEMDLHYNNLSSLLKSLVKRGILARFTTQDRTMYVMNPYIARKSRDILAEVCELFPDFNSPKHE